MKCTKLTIFPKRRNSQNLSIKNLYILKRKKKQDERDKY